MVLALVAAGVITTVWMTPVVNVLMSLIELLLRPIVILLH